MHAHMTRGRSRSVALQAWSGSMLANPPDAQGDGVGALVQPAVVQLQARVVHVDCGTGMGAR